MIVKSLIPLSLLVLLGGFSYKVVVSPLGNSFLDSSFYHDSSLFNRFETDRLIYDDPIVVDEIGARDYFFKNSLNLYLKCNNNSGNDSCSDIFGNAFILNVLYPDWLEEKDPGRSTYYPTPYSTNNDVTLLLGTSFSLVKKLFPQVSNWKTEVNESSTAPSLKNKFNDVDSKYKLYLSQPSPEIVTDSKSRSKPELNHLYWLSAGDFYSNYPFELHKSHYITLDTSRVEAVYAAVDLEVNQELIDMNLLTNDSVNNGLHRIHNYKNGDIKWTNTMYDGFGKSYKLATDFAVLQVKLQIDELRGYFLNYIQNLYKKTEVIPQVLRSELEVLYGKTKPLYLAGWNSMKPNDRAINDMKNLFIKATVKSGQKTTINSVVPSSLITKEKFEGCFDLDVYERYYDEKETKSDSYEIVDIEYKPNDVDGILYVNFKIKDKKTGQKTLDKKTVYYPNLKSSSTSTDTKLLTDHIDAIQKKNKDLVEFLESKPKTMAIWKEIMAKHTYFPFTNLKRRLLDSVYWKNRDINVDNPVDIFEIGSDKYVNIAHRLDIPNLNLVNAKGAPVIIEKSNSDRDKAVLGMYDGTNHWDNPLSSVKSTGKIMLLISPWGYDLLNSNNNLSKPTLADSLSKKSRKKYIVQRNRFYIK